MKRKPFIFTIYYRSKSLEHLPQQGDAMEISEMDHVNHVLLLPLHFTTELGNSQCARHI